ncbi:MAG: AAA family ATPase [Trebonia sp.]
MNPPTLGENPEIAGAPDVSAEGAHALPETVATAARSAAANVGGARASTRPGGNHPEPTPENQTRDSEQGREKNESSCQQHTQPDGAEPNLNGTFDEIFTPEELARSNDQDRAATEQMWRDTGSKEFALTLVREVRLCRARSRHKSDACQIVVRCAINENLTRETPAVGQPLMPQLIAIFKDVNVADIWDREEKRHARKAQYEEFAQNADPRLNERFVSELWQERCSAEDNSSPDLRAQTALGRLLDRADQEHLDGAAVVAALEEAFGEWVDVAAARQKHADERARQARERLFCSALANAAGQRYDTAWHDLAKAYACVETLRDDPDSENAIDGLETWIDKNVHTKRQVAAVDFLAAKINEFAAGDAAYDDLRLSLAAMRQDALTQTITESIGAEVAKALDKNDFTLDEYLSKKRDAPAALWGSGKEILWATGEALLICSDIGCGKTTLAGLLARALLHGGNVFGYPVQPLRDNPRVLYLALDRPQQIARSLARQVTPEMSEQFGEQFKFIPGPLDIDLSETPAALTQIADYYGADIVIIDSLKDVAMGISEDRAMAAYNRARQTLLAGGRELIELHHLTKKGDLFGAKWLDAGVGSVLRISGKPGGLTSTVAQYKPVAHLVQPIKIIHDRDAGEMNVVDGMVETEAATEPSLVVWVGQHGDAGVTAAQLAAHRGGDVNSEAAIVKAKRTLNALTGVEGPLLRVDGHGRGNATRWTVKP